MTKKDYELIASAVKAVIDSYEGDKTDIALNVNFGAELVAKHLASKLSFENPRFNTEKFLTACGL